MRPGDSLSKNFGELIGERTGKTWGPAKGINQYLCPRMDTQRNPASAPSAFAFIFPDAGDQMGVQGCFCAIFLPA